MSEQERMDIRDKIERDICTYGRPVLDSEIWSRAIHQVHHIHWTVGSHSMSVCIAALRMSYFLEEKGIEVNREKLVRAALCHDLGIVGRDDKYANNMICCMLHPVDSLPIAKQLYPDIDEDTLMMIRTHMWPLCIQAPSSLEGVLITLADKYAATGEGIPIFWLEKYQKEFNQFMLMKVQTNPNNKIMIPLPKQNRNIY